MKLAGIVNLEKSSNLRLPKTEKEKKLFKRKLLNFALGVIGFIILLFLWYAKDIPTPAKLAKIQAAESTKILARNGDVLYSTGEERRTVIDKNLIPQNIKQAAVSIEDPNFYKHSGVDFKGIARAVFADILNLKFSQGGSTITQQFVKNAVLTNRKSISRKIKEVILSIEIEQIYSKEDILAMYLNEIPYGGNIYGVQEASKMFFGKEAKDLSLPEAATMAAISNAPTYYSPYGTHTNELFTRKNKVLDKMVDQGYITREQADQAKKEAPNKEKPDFKPKTEYIKAPHFVMYIKQKLVEEYGEKMVDTGGLTVTTTLDSDMQKNAEAAVTNGAAKFERYGATNGALVSVNATTGEIVAMVGSKDYFDIQHDGNVNVTDSLRQPGSSFKPIVYATAFKQPRFSPSFNLFDLTTEFGNYRPNNYDGSTHGPVTMRTALSNSLNIPAVKTLALVGVDQAVKTAKDMGITSLTQPDRYGLALVLGGAEVRPIEMAGAFSAFANNGEFHKPVGILKIEDSKRKVLYEYKPDTNKFQAIDPQIAYQISNILDDDDARCMVFGCQNALNFGDQHVAAKTGTTSEFRDAWTVGYTTKYSTAVWVGNNDNTKMKSGADGSVIAAPIFHEYMNKLTDGSDFTRPSGIQEITVEKFSNRLPNQNSKELVKDIFASWQVPTEKDNVNSIFRVNKTNNLIATESTPAELVEEKVFSNLHNEWGDDWKKYPNWESPVRAWAEANGFYFPPTEKDGSYSRIPTITITSPANGVTVKGQITISVSIDSQHDVKEVTYYLNDSQIGSSSSKPFSLSIDTKKYSQGSQTLSARMQDSNGVTARSNITINISNPVLTPTPVKTVKPSIVPSPAASH
jgi:1A family penicillin-binding protein